MKYTSDEQRILNEYVIADRKMYQNGKIDFTLIPTYVNELPKKISIDCKDSDKFQKDAFYPGGLVTLTAGGTIKPVKYDMRKCDTMLVTGAYNTFNTSRILSLMGKKFGQTILYISPEPIHIWHQKFYSTERGDIVLVRPTNPKLESDNEYQILRNFTMEEKIRKFFESQRQR